MCAHLTWSVPHQLPSWMTNRRTVNHLMASFCLRCVYYGATLPGPSFDFNLTAKLKICTCRKIYVFYFNFWYLALLSCQHSTDNRIFNWSECTIFKKNHLNFLYQKEALSMRKKLLQATLKHHRRRPAGRRDLDLETTAAGRSAWLMIPPIIPRRFCRAFPNRFQVFRIHLAVWPGFHSLGNVWTASALSS